MNISDYRMKKELLPFEQTGAFSSFFLDYAGNKPELKNFFSLYPTVSNFAEQIGQKKKSFTAESRSVLKTSLEKQYASMEVDDQVRKNLDLIASDKTFTIVTGHQLNIFSGPLYFIYKIVTTINACQQLKAAYPEYNFVPVYWMASEDHDFEEISYFKLLGKKYTWKTDQRGAVGRMHLNDLLPLLKEIPGDLEPFASAYKTSATLAEAVRKYVTALFGKDGLIVIDADDPQLKNRFTDVMEADLFSGVTKKLVDRTNQELVQAGYEPQVLARDINFFFLDNGIRERIEYDGTDYRVLETTQRFSTLELQELIRQSPEKLSPNVILRPLYQEMILPNLAYIGGPAEMVYWLQLKKVFDHFSVPFPVLLPRNFALIADQTSVRLMKKAGVSITELFQNKQHLLNTVVIRNTTHSLSLEDHKKVFEKTLAALREQALTVDPTLSKMVDAELHRINQGIERMEHKMLRAEKRKGSDVLRQTEAVKEKLFPGGGLQERTDNLLNFYQTDRNFINSLRTLLDPFDLRFHVLIYE